MIKRKKIKRYAVTYIPKTKRWAVTHLKKGETLPKKYLKDTTMIRSTSPSKALRTLSERSYYGETGRRLKRKRR